MIVSISEEKKLLAYLPPIYLEGEELCHLSMAKDMILAYFKDSLVGQIMFAEGKAIVTIRDSFSIEVSLNGREALLKNQGKNEQESYFVFGDVMKNNYQIYKKLATEKMPSVVATIVPKLTENVFQANIDEKENVLRLYLLIIAIFSLTK